MRVERQALCQEMSRKGQEKVKKNSNHVAQGGKI
jgi:hypothetical protein